MPGYFTDSRDTKVPLPMTASLLVSGREIKLGELDVSPVAMQLTTSFRSRGQSDDELIADADKIYINGFKDLSSKFDTGHAFFSKKRTFLTSHNNATLLSADPDLGFAYQYKGAIRLLDGFGGFVGFPDEPSFGWLNLEPLSDSEIAFYGHQAISATTPTHPVAQFSDFLAQSLSTKLPKLIGDIGRIYSFARLARESGDQWVNLEFGWVPFISDLRALFNMVLDSYKIVTDYKNGSGRTTRRRYNISDETVTHAPQVSLVGARLESPANFDSDILEDVGKLESQSSVRTRIWFSGAYTYYLPNSPGFLGRMERYASLAQKLLGLNFTPQVLWDLAPWSWLADWQFDLTSQLAINNDLSTDNLVLKYGYLMREISARSIYTAAVRARYGRGTQLVRNSYSVIQKERVRATPYGFAVNPETFSLKQLSILAALGLSMSPKTLK